MITSFTFENIQKHIKQFMYRSDKFLVTTFQMRMREMES